MTDLTEFVLTATTWILPALFAITLHEAAHGIVAWRLGDDTAYNQGRVTLNPLAHIDPFGTVILPGLLLAFGGILFGYAKPVPVAFWRLRNPRRDMVLVALAGPGTNLLLALVSALLVHTLAFWPENFAVWLAANLRNSIVLNLILAVFNMLPLPPLDGGRVAVGLLPRALAEPLARLERFGLLILVGLIFLLPFVGSRLGFDLNIFRWLILGPVEVLYGIILRIAGVG